MNRFKRAVTDIVLTVVGATLTAIIGILAAALFGLFYLILLALNAFLDRRKPGEDSRL